MRGFRDTGSGHPIRVPTGVIPTTTIISRAGVYTKGTGTVKITEIITMMAVTTMTIDTTGIRNIS